MQSSNGALRLCVFDSGIGGLPFLKAIHEEWSGVSISYVADDAGFPYGTKSPEAIRDILFERVRRIRARLDPDILVISCMTAVQIGLKDLQAAHRSMKIVGAIPPIAQAAGETQSRRIAVLTTARAAEDAFLDDMIARDAPEIDVFRIPAQDLVDYVEQHLPFAKQESAEAAVEPYVVYALENGADRLVLASSHFVFLEEAIRHVIAARGMHDVRCLDPRAHVLSALRRFLFSEPAAENVAETSFYLTGDRKPCPSYIAWANRFGTAEPELL
jgi:glutamate racemase